MATFKEFTSSDITTRRGVLARLFEVPQSDISSSQTRKSYQVFVTGGVGPGVTSSLWHTVFDQDYTRQTANPVFDLTFGLAISSSLVQTGSLLYVDTSTNKHYFSSQSLMMREKTEIYRAHAQSLLGDASSEFQLVSGATTSNVREALFIDVKRLFMGDQVKRGTFSINMFQSTSFFTTLATGQKTYTDQNATQNIESSYGGQVSTIVDSNNTSYPVGLMYNDKGIAVFDISRVFDVNTNLSGTIDGMCTGGTLTFTGSLNKLMVSGSVDDVLDHICFTRFSNSSGTAMAFESNAYMNTTQFFCLLGPDEFNYSSNPTFTDSTGRIVVIDPGQEETQRSFTFVTGIGLYDAHGNCLAVGKPSRPIFKDDQRYVPIRIKLDF